MLPRRCTLHTKSALSSPGSHARKAERPDSLLYSFTVDDPGSWNAPWSGEYPWPASNTRVYEYACHEGNYAMEGILKGARLLEQEMLEGAGGGN